MSTFDVPSNQHPFSLVETLHGNNRSREEIMRTVSYAVTACLHKPFTHALPPEIPMRCDHLLSKTSHRRESLIRATVYAVDEHLRPSPKPPAATYTSTYFESLWLLWCLHRLRLVRDSCTSIRLGASKCRC